MPYPGAGMSPAQLLVGLQPGAGWPQAYTVDTVRHAQGRIQHRCPITDGSPGVLRKDCRGLGTCAISSDSRANQDSGSYGRLGVDSLQGEFI
jgi:hypothetical protein